MLQGDEEQTMPPFTGRYDIDCKYQTFNHLKEVRAG